MNKNWIYLIIIIILILLKIAVPAEKVTEKPKKVIKRAELIAEREKILDYVYWICRYYPDKRINLNTIAPIFILECDFRNGVDHPVDYVKGIMGIKEITFITYTNNNPSTTHWKFEEIKLDYKKNIKIGIWTFNQFLKRAENLREAYADYRHGPSCPDPTYLYADKALMYMMKDRAYFLNY